MRDFLVLVFRQKNRIVGVAAACFLVAVLSSSFKTTLGEARAKLLIDVRPVSLDASATSNQSPLTKEPHSHSVCIQVAASCFDSDDVLKRAAADIGVRSSLAGREVSEYAEYTETQLLAAVASLREKIRVEISRDSPVLAAAFTSQSAEHSRKCLSAIIDSYLLLFGGQASALANTETTLPFVRAYWRQITILQTPMALNPPTSFLRSATWWLAAFIASLAVGLGVGILLERLDQSIRAPDDVERRLGIPLLASAPLLTRRTSLLLRASQYD